MKYDKSVMMQGGTQGFPAGVDVNSVLPEFAGSDFRHDFKDDKISTNVLNDIETVGNRISFIKKIEPLVGKSAFEIFQAGFRLSIPAGVGVFKEEDNLLRDNGIPYQDIAAYLGKFVYGVAPLPLNISKQIPRNYSMRIALEKVKRGAVGTEYEGQLKPEIPSGQYVNLLSCLWAVSGLPKQRKKSFVIMYDAGTCGTSELADFSKPSISDILSDPMQFLGEEFNKTDNYEVYFVNNTENVRDPAPKITEKTFKKTPGNVSIYFLKDYGHKVRYDMLSKSTQALQTSNLYSNYSITTNRDQSGDKVRAVVEFQDGSSIQLDDVKRESEIGSSIINAVSMFLKNGGNRNDPKLMSYFFLKRSGDWCQALSLLDKQRAYTIEGYGPNVGRTVNLQQLEDNGSEVMLMTHDRILLAYSLALGINVLFTNNRPSGHWLVYFKNTDVFRVDDYTKLLTDAKAYVATLTTLQAKANAARAEALEAAQNTLWFPLTNIITLRAAFTLLANLPSDETIVAAIGTLNAFDAKLQPAAAVVKYFTDGGQLQTLPPPQQQQAKLVSDELGKLRNALPNVQSTMDIVTKYVSAFTYPNQAEEVLAFGPDFTQVLTEQKSMKSSYRSSDDTRTFNLEAAFIVIAERLVDDVLSAGGSLTFPTDLEIPEQGQAAYKLPRITRTQITTLRGIIDIFSKALRKKLGARGQSGGVGTTPDAYFLAQSVNLITEISIPTEAGEEWVFTPGEKYIHYDRWEYTVVDSYIVTKENRANLLGALVQATQLTPALTAQAYSLPYIGIIILRLLILYSDILGNEARLVYDAIKTYSDEEFDRLDLEYNTPDKIILGEISIRAQMLNKIAQFIVSPGYTVDGVVAMLRAYEDNQFGTLQPSLATIPSDIETLRKGFTEMYLAKVGGFMKALRLAEVSGSNPAIQQNPNFVILFEPATGKSVPYEYTPTNARFVGSLTLELSEKPQGFGSWQNIATNVYVPLLPQPAPRVALFGSGGGRRPLYSKTRHAVVQPKKRAKTRRNRKSKRTSRTR